MKTIKYIGFYNTNELNQNRNAQLPAINKMNYIIDVLNRCNYSVKVISPAWSKGNKTPSTKKRIGYNEIIMPFSFKNKGLFKLFNHIYSLSWLFFFLLRNCKKNEQILVYHSLYYMSIISVIRKIKKIRIILEVEELYSDVISASEKYKKKEIEYINKANKYIWVSNTLRKSLKNNNNNYCVINGSYNIEKQVVSKYNDGKKHLVYSGIIDYNKGAFNAVKMCAYLDEKYMVHIIGYGDNKTIENLKKEIEKSNNNNKCIVKYDGIKKGEEYINYIQKCDIGLSIQDKKASYNLTSFPSKILAYLSNGLRVVSVDLPAINDSEIKGLIYFYNGNSAQEIAKTIKSIDLKQKYDSRVFINMLDKKTKKEIKGLLYDE